MHIKIGRYKLSFSRLRGPCLRHTSYYGVLTSQVHSLIEVAVEEGIGWKIFYLGFGRSIIAVTKTMPGHVPQWLKDLQSQASGMNDFVNKLKQRTSKSAQRISKRDGNVISLKSGETSHR